MDEERSGIIAEGRAEADPAAAPPIPAQPVAEPFGQEPPRPGRPSRLRPVLVLLVIAAIIGAAVWYFPRSQRQGPPMESSPKNSSLVIFWAAQIPFAPGITKSSLPSHLIKGDSLPCPFTRTHRHYAKEISNERKIKKGHLSMPSVTKQPKHFPFGRSLS